MAIYLNDMNIEETSNFLCTILFWVVGYDEIDILSVEIDGIFVKKFLVSSEVILTLFNIEVKIGL